MNLATMICLHNVGLVDAGDLLSTSQVSILKGILSNLDSLFSGDDLQRFENTWEDFVLNSGVLTLEIVSNDHKIDIVVSGGNIWEVMEVANLHI